MAREKVFEFEDPSRGMHIFLCGYAGDGRFVHLHRLGDVVQHHGLHRFFTKFEEALLEVDDTVGDLEQGFVTALKTLEEPFGFLQMTTNKMAVSLTVCATLHNGILLIEVDLGHAIRVELYNPASLLLSYCHIGDDIFVAAGGYGQPWTGV